MYPEIPKGKFKGTYIAGGIFLLLYGFPILLLYIPQFFLSFGIVLWDWNMVGLGITLSFLENLMNWACYLAFPWVMFFVSLVAMFLPSTKSSGFVKGSLLCFFLAILFKYSFWITDIPSSVLQVFSYGSMALASIGTALLIAGIIFRLQYDERLEPYKANSFHIFSGVFWTLITLFVSFGTTIGISSTIVRWAFPFACGLYGVAGGLWMLCTCRRPDEFKFSDRERKIYDNINNDGANTNLDNLSPKEQRKQEKELAILQKMQEKEAKKAQKQAEKENKKLALQNTQNQQNMFVASMEGQTQTDQSVFQNNKTGQINPQSINMNSTANTNLNMAQQNINQQNNFQNVGQNVNAQNQNSNTKINPQNINMQNKNFAQTPQNRVGASMPQNLSNAQTTSTNMPNQNSNAKINPQNINMQARMQNVSQNQNSNISSNVMRPMSPQNAGASGKNNQPNQQGASMPQNLGNGQNFVNVSAQQRNFGVNQNLNNPNIKPQQTKTNGTVAGQNGKVALQNPNAHLNMQNSNAGQPQNRVGMSMPQNLNNRQRNSLNTNNTSPNARNINPQNPNANNMAKQPNLNSQNVNVQNQKVAPNPQSRVGAGMPQNLNNPQNMANRGQFANQGIRPNQTTNGQKTGVAVGGMQGANANTVQGQKVSNVPNINNIVPNPPTQEEIERARKLRENANAVNQNANKSTAQSGTTKPQKDEGENK